MKRIHWHWTAGAPGVNAKEADSYNFVISWPDGEVIECIPVERQIPPLVNGAYAAHTKDANSWAIGIAVDAMADAQERPFSAGKYPITQKQIDALVKLSRDLGRQYGIPVTRETMLGHAEVEPTLGIKQNRKWDIRWLPGMDAPGDAVSVGDTIRAMIRNTKPKGAKMPASNIFAEDFDPEPAAKREARADVLPTLAYGAGFGLKNGDERVRSAQIRLKELGYTSGRIDGKFGTRVEGSVTEFQRDQGIPITRVIDDRTREAMANAVPRAERDITKADLKDSRTIKAADEGKVITAGAAGLGTAYVAVETAEQVADVAQRAGGLVQGLLSVGPWPLLALAVIGIGAFLLWRRFGRIEDLRIEDARTGANDSR